MMIENTTENMICPQCGKVLIASQVDEMFDGVCPRCLFESVLGENRDVALQTTMVKSEPDDTEHPVGTEFGNYVILGVLGTGGMGVVYRAHQKGLERNVALKILPSGDDAPEDLVERFFREARSAATLKHPNIVPIIEVSSHEGTYFYSMELVEGQTLSNLMKESEPGSREQIEILIKIARAVHYANERDVIHRDLKPANIMIDSHAEPKVLDFGIAKTLGTQSNATATGSAMGTPPYMSPEQVRGSKDIDARADVYSLGAMLYQILTTQVPYDGTTAMEIFRKLATEEVRPPSKINPKIARDLEVICLKALEKEKSNRYDSAEALATDLERYLKGDRIEAKPAPLRRKAGRFLKRNMAWGAVASILMLVGGVVYLKVKGDSQAETKTIIVKEKSTDSSPEVKRVIERAGRTIEMVRFGTTPPERRERLGKLDAGIAEVTEMLQTWPEHGELYYWRGRLKEESNRQKAALVDYNRAVEHDPNLADARYRRNICWSKIFQGEDISLGNMAGLDTGGINASQVNTRTAAEDLEALKKLNVAREQVVLLEAMVKYSKAIEGRDEDLLSKEEKMLLGNPVFLAAEASLELNPAFYDGLVVKYESWWNKWASVSKEERLHLANRMISLRPNDPTGYQALTFVFRKRPDPGRVLATMHHAIEIDPENAGHLMERAQYFQINLGMPEFAVRDYGEARRYAPGSTGPTYFYTIAYLSNLKIKYSFIPQKAWRDLEIILDGALAIPAGDFFSRAFKRNLHVLRAGIRNTYLEDEKGAREDYEAVKKLEKTLEWNRVNRFQDVMEEWDILDSMVPKMSSEKEDFAKGACVDFARFLCSRIELGADRGKTSPYATALLKKAIELGYVPTEEDKKGFAPIMDEPGVKELFAKVRGPESESERKRVIERAGRTIEMVRFGTSPPQRRERLVKLDAAISEVDEMLQNWPENGELYYWRGRLKEAANRIEKAVEDYHTAVKFNPDLADARYRRNVTACKAFKNEHVPAVTRRLYSSYLGRFQISEENFMTAKEDLEALKRLNVAREQVVLLKALSEYAVAMKELEKEAPSQGDREEVRKALYDAAEESLKINSTCFDGLVVKFWTGLDLGSHKLLLLADQIIALQPNIVSGYLAKSVACRPSYDPGQALSAMHHSIELETYGFVAILDRGIYFHLGLGIPELSLMDFEEALRQNPSFIIGYAMKVSAILFLASRKDSPIPKETWREVKAVLDEALSHPTDSRENEGMAYIIRAFRAYIRHTHFDDEKGAREDYEICNERAKEAAKKNEPGFRKPMPFVEFLSWTATLQVQNSSPAAGDLTRKAAVDFGRFLCGRLELGADREKTVPYVTALLKKAIELGYVPTEEDRKSFSPIMDEPGVKDLFKKVGKEE